MGAVILMPALSPTMTEGKLARWLKKTGDKVKSGEVIAEIETDKATMEVETVDEGVLTAILVPEGTENVAVNTAIAELDGGAGSAKAAPAPMAGQRLWLPRLPRLPCLPRRAPQRLRRIGARPSPSRYAKPCAMPWRRKCALMRMCS